MDGGNPDLGLRHQLKIGPRILEIAGFASPLTVAPGVGRRLFALGEPGSFEVFRDWERFVDRLQEKRNSDAKAQAMYARGYARGAFDAGSTTLKASYVAVALTLP